MTTTQSLVQEATIGVVLLYAVAITITVLTALATPDPDQRRTALKVLALLVQKSSDPEP